MTEPLLGFRNRDVIRVSRALRLSEGEPTDLTPPRSRPYRRAADSPLIPFDGCCLIKRDDPDATFPDTYEMNNTGAGSGGNAYPGANEQRLCLKLPYGIPAPRRLVIAISMKQLTEWVMTYGAQACTGGEMWIYMKTFLITEAFDVHAGDAAIATWNSLGCGEPPAAVPDACIVTQSSLLSEVGSPWWCVELGNVGVHLSNGLTMKLDTTRGAGNDNPTAFMIREPSRTNVKVYGIMLAVNYWQEGIIGLSLSEATQQVIVRVNEDSSRQSWALVIR